MQALYCPDCGRYCGATDAPPGYVVRIPRCTRCRKEQLLSTGAAAPGPPARLVPSRRPPPIRAR